MSPPIRTLRVRFTLAEMERVSDDCRKGRGLSSTEPLAAAELERWVHACVMASMDMEAVISSQQQGLKALATMAAWNAAHPGESS